jgi:hypothetical protein
MGLCIYEVCVKRRYFHFLMKIIAAKIDKQGRFEKMKIKYFLTL